MFYYYGAKAQLSGKYPAPQHPVIVEPFAGAAGYAMRHVKSESITDVVLVDRDRRVVELWDRLLRMTADDVLDYPSPTIGSYTTDYFVMTAAASNAMSKAKHLKVTPRVVDVFDGLKTRVAGLLPYCQSKVRLIHGDYRCLGNMEATWFVDPPYALPPVPTRTSSPRGAGYLFGADSLDYGVLGSWCLERAGQVIVCEGDGADWLPFNTVVRPQSHNRCGEVAWVK